MKRGVLIFILGVFLLMGFVSAECSTEKNLIAKGFKINHYGSPDDPSLTAVLDYDEEGLCIEDLYWTEFDYSLNRGKTFHADCFVGSRFDRPELEGLLELNGPGLEFSKMLLYKLTFRTWTVRAMMDFVPQDWEVDWESDLLGKDCSSDTECDPSVIGEKSTNLICIQEKCTPIIQLNNFIKETNENDNCIQQEFKIKLFAKDVMPISDAVPCNYTNTVKE